MELPRMRTYEGPPAILYPDTTYERLSDYDFFASDISPLDVLRHRFGSQGTNWDIVLSEDTPDKFDVVIYPDGKEYERTGV